MMKRKTRGAIFGILIFFLLVILSLSHFVTAQTCSSVNGTIFYPYYVNNVNDNSRQYCNGTEFYASDGDCCIGRVTNSPTTPCPTNETGTKCIDVSNNNNKCPNDTTKLDYYCAGGNMKCCYNSTEASQIDFENFKQQVSNQMTPIIPMLKILAIIGAIVAVLIQVFIQALILRYFIKKKGMDKGYWRAWISVLFPSIIIGIIVFITAYFGLPDFLIIIFWLLYFIILIFFVKLFYKTDYKSAFIVSLELFIVLVIILIVLAGLQTIFQNHNFFANLKNLLV